MRYRAEFATDSVLAGRPVYDIGVLGPAGNVKKRQSMVEVIDDPMLTDPLQRIL